MVCSIEWETTCELRLNELRVLGLRVCTYGDAHEADDYFDGHSILSRELETQMFA